MDRLNDDFLVSVIMPTYNGGEVLKRSIDSVINQSIGLKNIEFIIVDDASTDDITRKIILDYQLRFPDNIKPIFLDTNSGNAGMPRNIGIEKSSCDYIILLDDDDNYLNDAFKLLYSKIIEYDSDLVIGNHYANLDNYKVRSMKYLNENIININPLNDQKTFDILNTVDGGAPWAKIYRKDVILNNNLKYIPDITFDDMHFYLNFLKHSQKVTVLPNDLVYAYQIHEDSMVHTHNIKLFNKNIKGMYSISEVLKDINLNLDHILSYMIAQLLLVFSDLDSNDKNNAILKLYNLEKYLENNFNFHFKFRKELIILNNYIIQKKFKKAIFLSNIYKKLYNNKTIQKYYKKYR